MNSIVLSDSSQDLIDRFDISANFVRSGNRLRFEFSSNSPDLSDRLAQKLHLLLAQQFSPNKNNIECFLEVSGFTRSVVLNPLSTAASGGIIRKVNRLFNQYFGLSGFESRLQPVDRTIVFSDDEKELDER